jgi:hypothetical protein
MKTFVKLTLATLLLSGTAWAQSEQWLEYHTAANNEYHGYSQVQLTTTPPANVTLPKLDAGNGKPYFAEWKTPMDPSGKRWICVDRTRKTGPYNRLFIDSNGNGRLDDETPVMARLDSNFGHFSATPLTFKGEDGPITYHLAFRFYQYGNNQAQLVAQSAGWYEGSVKFDGVKKHLRLMDNNVNGTFNDIKSDPYRSDCVEVDDERSGTRFLGRLLEVDGKYFTFNADRDGAFVKVQKADVTLGPVQMPTNITSFAAFGTNGYFVRQAAKGEFTLPVGQYRVVSWEIQRKDDKGANWELSAYNFPDTHHFEVVASQPVVLDIGEPVKAVLTSKARGTQTGFDLKFVGKQGEDIQFLRDNQRPRGPKLMLANADGTLCYTNTFEFG